MYVCIKCMQQIEGERELYVDTYLHVGGVSVWYGSGGIKEPGRTLFIGIKMIPEQGIIYI